MWIKITDSGQLVFEGTLHQFNDCFGGPAECGADVFKFACHRQLETVEIYEDGEWVSGKPGFDGNVFCCFKNPYNDKPPVIQGECAVYSSGEVLFLSELVEEVYGWLPIPECPYAPDKS